MSDWPTYPMHKGIVSTISKEAARLPMISMAGAVAPVSTAVGTTNLAFFVPFTIFSPYPVANVWWLNGSTAAGQVSCGVYTAGAALLSVCSNTTQAGTSVIQKASVTASVLMPDQYYIAISFSSANSTIFSRTTTNARRAQQIGMAQQTSAFPLPDPATLAAFATQSIYPVCGLLSGSVI